MNSLLCSTLNTRRVFPDSDRFLRSDAPCVLEESDVAWLRSHEVRTLIDLRSAEEVAARPCALEGRDGFTVLHLPMSCGGALPAEAQAVPQSYLSMLNVQTRRVLDAIESAETNAMFFCTAGKDRTGVVAALLQLRRGVAREQIVADYMASREYLAELLQSYCASHPGMDPCIVIPQERYMLGFLAQAARHPLAARVFQLQPDSPWWERACAFAVESGWDVGEHFAWMLRERVFTDWEAAFAAVCEDRIMGVSTLMKTDYYPENRYTPWISSLFVAEADRGWRLSARLIEAARRYAGALGFARAYLPTPHKNLYEKYGFTKIDELVNYGGDTDHVYMRETR